MDHGAALVRQNRLLSDVTRVADPAAPVPTCPGWSVRKLVAHVGRGDRWAAEIVERQVPVDIRSVRDGRPPEEPDLAAAWLTDSPRLLIDSVAAVGPEVPVWTFLGPRPAAWWIRRRLHEVVVHHADAALALGVPFVVEPEVAADGVAEFLDLLSAREGAEGAPALEPGVALHLHATDPGLGEAGEWLVRGTGPRIGWEHGHGKGDVAVRGRAADLLLALLRRIPAEDARVQVLGEAAVWTRWLERTPF